MSEPRSPPVAPPPSRTPSRVLVEACVTGVEEAVAAQAAGAGRLELCRELDTGGLTPTPETLAAVLGRVTVPVNVMVRLRPGPFTAAPEDVAVMVGRVEEALRAGANGVVVGLLGADARVDVAATRALVAAAGGRPVTFHRGFDQTPDLLEAMEDVLRAGIARVLTGGGPGRAADGASTLAALVRRAGDEVEVLAGGGVRGDHVVRLVEATGVREVHARAIAVPGLTRALAFPG